MKSDGPLILALLFLAAGLTMIFTYGVRTGSFNAAYPFSAANLQMSVSTVGPAAIGGDAAFAAASPTSGCESGIVVKKPGDCGRNTAPVGRVLAENWRRFAASDRTAPHIRGRSPSGPGAVE